MLKKIKLMQNTFVNEKNTKSQLIKFILKSDKLSMGNKVKIFEKKFSRIINKKYTTMVNSGSSANLVLLQALKNLNIIKTNDKIAISAVTWSTSVMPIIQLGLNPIPVDINLNTFNCNYENFQKVINKNNIKIFFITNAMGFCDNLDRIRTLCKKKKIILLEDNCESLGSEYKNKKLGSFGLASTHSFFVGHHISSIEGGSISTNSKKLDNMIKIVRAHGWSRSLDLKSQKYYLKKFKTNQFYKLYTFYDLAFNVRPTDLNGLLGTNQLGYLKKIIKQRENNFYKIYQEYLKNKNFIPYKLNNMNLISNFAFPIICKNKVILKKYLKIFSKLNIETRPFIGGNITKQPFFRKYIKKKYYLPNADIIHNYCFYCPNNFDLSKENIDRIILGIKS
jgi:CDP-6-deoxy-D-xylo-4-hexulose-3-dehydrase